MENTDWATRSPLDESLIPAILRDDERGVSSSSLAKIPRRQASLRDELALPSDESSPAERGPARGGRTTNVAPQSRLLRARICPPWAVTIEREMARPSPSPTPFDEKNGSKTPSVSRPTGAAWWVAGLLG